MSFGDMKEEATIKRKDKIAGLEHGERSLDKNIVENVTATDVDVPDNKTKNPVLARRAARKRKLQKSCKRHVKA
nr:hypothetical protein [Tanacetum cinerariifolium]